MSVNKQKKQRSLVPLPWTAFVPLSDASRSDVPGATSRPTDCLQTSIVVSQDPADLAASEARWQAFTDEFLKAKEAGAEEEDEIVEVDSVAEEERLAREAGRERIWEWVVARCLESMPEWDRQQWVREQREQERLEEWQERMHTEPARAKRDESWADWSGSRPASEYIEY